MKKIFLSFKPTRLGKLALWAINYKVKLVVRGPEVGLTPADITNHTDWSQAVIEGADKVTAKRAEYYEAVAAMKQISKNELKLLGNAIQSMKKHPLFKEAIGDELGIMGTVKVFDPAELKPLIKGVARDGKVDISFKLQGMNFVSVYSRIQGTTAWTRLGSEYASPYEDKRPLAIVHQPEIREYMCKYFDGKEDVGLVSDIVTVIFGGTILLT
jgi:hypothetical protein